MEQSFVTSSDDNYTSIHYDQASSVFENVNYTSNNYELTSIHEEQTAASGWTNDVTTNPAYSKVHTRETDAVGYNSRPRSTEPSLKNQKALCILAVVSLAALMFSIGALLCAILTPMSYKKEKNQQAALVTQRNNCTPTKFELANSTVSQQQLQCLEAKIEQLEDRVKELTTKINAPINLYESCFEETQFCYLRPAIGLYWRQCATGELPMDIPDHYTQSMRCEHRSRRFGIFQESAYLRPDDTNQNVRCVCDTTYPRPDEPGHFVIPDNEDADLFCQMVIVRCPLTKTLFNNTV